MQVSGYYNIEDCTRETLGFITAINSLIEVYVNIKNGVISLMFSMSKSTLKVKVS